jgi:hypothetical protein
MREDRVEILAGVRPEPCLFPSASQAQASLAANCSPELWAGVSRASGWGQVYAVLAARCMGGAGSGGISGASGGRVWCGWEKANMAAACSRA